MSRPKRGVPMNTNNTAINDDFFVEIITQGSTSVFKFTMSKTGVLDYHGEVENFNDADYQQIEASSYFSPSWYTYLPANLQAEIKICFKYGAEKLDSAQYSFLLHIGAVLLAVKERDGLLVAELLNRRPTVFSQFLPMVLYIIKPVAATALFAWLFGRFNDNSGLQSFYTTGAGIDAGETDTGIILYTAAKDDLKPVPYKESMEEMFIRFFKEEEPREFTIGLVGSQCHSWNDGFYAIEKAINHHVAKDFVEGFAALRAARQKFFDGLKVCMQAEPYNPHDPNAIGVSIEDMEAKIAGNGGKTKAGYIRATGAAILRKALPGKLAYTARLWRIGNSQESKQGAVLKIRM